MIFISVGSQKFQFDRLIKEMDRIAENSKEEIVGQIGYSNYIPKNYAYKRFMNKEEFNENLMKSRIVVTHGGTANVVSSIKNNKKTIVVPRLSKFDEHVDNHQIQIGEEFQTKNYISFIKDIDDIEQEIAVIENKKFSKYKSTSYEMLKDLKEYIDELML